MFKEGPSGKPGPGLENRGVSVTRRSSHDFCQTQQSFFRKLLHILTAVVSFFRPHGVSKGRAFTRDSIRLMARAFELDIPATEKLVLIALADHARDDGTGAYPSIETLARKASLKRRGVQYVMRRLEAWGLIEPTAHKKGGRGFSTEYRITLEKGASQCTLSTEKGAPIGQKGRTTRPKRVHPGAPQPSLNVRELVAARIESAQHIEGSPVENPVQLTTLFKEATKKNLHPLPAWVRGEMGQALYRGVHGEAIQKAFFDSRFLEPEKQLNECVRIAVTSLVTSRVRTLKCLNADAIEKAALSDLLGGLATLSLVSDFTVRQRQTVHAVERAVIENCLRLLKEVAA